MLANEWWAVIRSYNERIFPMQLIAMLAIMTLAYLLLWKPSRTMSKVFKAYFGITNFWIGIGFFVLLGEGFKPPLNYSQGFLFVSIGALWLSDLYFDHLKLEKLAERKNRWVYTALLSILWLYPVIGLLRGEGMPSIILPGTLPCPTTAVGLVVLMAVLPQRKRLLSMLMLVWAIPFPPLIQIPKYGVVEDGLMFLMGLIMLVLWVRVEIMEWKSKRQLAEVVS